mmetsp:Transcript_7798/g.6969  ORF Transcript_7798/g.6969 Transcript_7798/m.6969 type:complete len:417 (-) Transcript_7798:107-1357(-)
MAQDQAKLKKRLELLLKLPENLTCADCGKRGPRWASANLGVFFCIECSGIHRNLGVHISFVRSVNLDSWTKAQVDFLEEWGNGRANEYYEANIPPHVTKPRDGDSVRVLEKFIRDKYEHKKYISKTIPPKRNIKLDELDDDNKRRNNATTRSRPSTSSNISSNNSIPSNVTTGPVLTSVAQKRDIPISAPVVTTNKSNSDSLLDFLDEPVVSNVNTTSNQSNDIFSSFVSAPVSAPVAPSIQQQHQHQQQHANQFTSNPNAFPVSPNQGSYNNQPNYQSYNTQATAPAPPLAVHIPAHHPPAQTKPQVSTADILSLYSNPVQSQPPPNPAYHGSTVPPIGYPGVPIYSQPNNFSQPNNYGQPQPYYTANYGQPNMPPPPVPNQVPYNQGYGNPNQPPNVFNQFQQNTGPYGGYNQR